MRDRGLDITLSLEREGGSGGQTRPEGCYLMVFAGGSSWMFPLPASGEVVVGRGDACALTIDDGSVSRNHCRIHVGDAEVRIADLKSHNGTLVNGARLLADRPLTSGDVIAIGAVTLVFHRSARVTSRRSLADLPRLRQRLEEEVERAYAYGRPVTVACLALDGVNERPKVREALTAHLRLLDIAAWDGEAQVLALLPEVGPREARRAVATLREAVAVIAPGARAGFATCPDDGGDVDALLAGARAAAAAAREGAIAACEETARTIHLGDRAVTIADPAMHRLFALLERLAASDLPVLITGETGAGKELAAWAIHHWSPRASGPMVALNCAALQETLAESELFGHEKGAFSGAAAAKPGRLEAAEHGTLFLDEVGELSASVQAKLLRALETRRVTRVGAVQDRPVDIRLVAATNRNLETEVKAGRFREDLYFRLCAATVVLPPLRDRRRDLPILARVLLAEACERLGRPNIPIAPDAMQLLLRWRWPGNVRELKNLMDYVAATAGDEELTPSLLPERITGRTPAAPIEATPNPAPEPEAAAGGPAPVRPIGDEIRDLERTRMTEALEATGGNRTRAAERIGMPLRTFLTKMKQYGLAEAGKK